ncbi:MAG: TonB-dependent receptor [Gammaproteobacteria bacterium]|nr:TonB-dependent receptor [Gammaproteobacteria bacterium]
MYMRKTGIARAIAAALLATAGAQALAQATGLEEIVVTAQKREQSLQDAPVAISAFGKDALQQQRITDVQDLNGLVPNVQFAAAPSSTTGATVAIRGAVTTNPAPSWEPTVGMYVDGVFIGKVLGGIFDVADLERVEVLRGPQGSLYGKNTVGGAINLVTRKPSGELSGELTAGMGNEGYWQVRGSLDTAAIGTVGEGLGQLSANITLQHEERDGFTRGVADPVGSPLAAPNVADEWEGLDSDAGRIALLLNVTENFEARYAYDFSNKDNTPQAPHLTHVDTSQVPFLLPYVVADDERADTLSSETEVFEEAEIDGHALHLGYDLGEQGFLGDVQIKSITSYREMSWDDLLDIDGSPIDAFHSGRGIDYEQTSEELQIVGSTDRVNYVLGYYYFDESLDVINPITFFGVFGAPTAPNAYGLEGESNAVFGQVDWKPGAAALRDRLTVTLGARYTEEEKEQYISHPIVIDNTLQVRPEWAFAGEADENWNNFSPSVTLSWDLTEEASVYARYAEGWKSGGFNGESSTLAEFQRAYDPEEVVSYEIGLKSRWLDNRVQVNAAAFENNVDDMQLSIFLADGSAASVVRNAGEATVRGFELEVLAEPGENRLVKLGWGYLDPEYDTYIDDTGANVADDRAFPYAPENTFSAGAQYTVSGVLGGNLVGRLDWNYTDDRVLYPEPEQNKFSKLDDYALLNGRLSLTELPLGNGSLEVAAWGKNLTDEEYRVSTIPFLIWTVSYFGAPRTYGMEVSYKF